MPFNLFKSKDKVDYKARMERKMCVARETPELIFDLSQCNLKSVPSGVFSLCKVLRKEALLLKDNLLTTISGGGALQDIVLLQVLDLQCNKIAKLPDDIGLLINLMNLNVSKNLLTRLPETMGQLSKLQTLNAAANKLSEVPVSLSRCRHLQCLDLRDNVALAELPLGLSGLPHLLVDSTVHCQGKESGSLPESEHEDLVVRDLKADTNYFLIEEKLKEIEQRKEEQKLERLVWEKSLADGNQKEFELHREMAGKRSKLVNDIKIKESDLEEELLKIQLRKDYERSKLIEKCLCIEEEMSWRVGNLVENANKARERMALASQRQCAVEHELLQQIHSTAHTADKSAVIEAMKELLEEEMLKAEKLRSYQAQRNKLTRHCILQESELSDRLSDLARQSQSNALALTDELLADELVQKAAVASLMAQSDARSWGLAQQVLLVEEQLAELTRLELARRQLQHEHQIVELSVSRVELMELLLALLAQQEERRGELVAALCRMEGLRRGEEGGGFWLEQYQRVLESSARHTVQAMRQVDARLHQELALHGVGHWLPLTAHLLTNYAAVASLTDHQLLQAGVTDVDGRFLLLKACKNYLSSSCKAPSAPAPEPASSDCLPSATPLPTGPPDPDDPTDCAPSAPPFSLAGSAACSPVRSLYSFVARTSEECVVCLEFAAEMIFVPCGHMCCCSACAFAGLELCPLCRTHVDQVLQTGLVKTHEQCSS